MKIAISSTGANLQAGVDPRFGRAAFLLIYDTDNREVVEVVNNAEGQDAAQGAGISVAGLIAQKGVAAILTGRVGPKAMAVIDKAGIKVISGVMGTVEEAIKSFMTRTKRQEPAHAAKARAAGVVPRSGCRSGKGRQGSGCGAGMGKGQGGRGMGRSPGR